MKFKTQAKVIRDNRKRVGLTQAEVASKVKVHTQLISNTERGIASFPVSRVQKLGDALKMKPDKLLEAMIEDVARSMRIKARL